MIRLGVEVAVLRDDHEPLGRGYAPGDSIVRLVEPDVADMRGAGEDVRPLTNKVPREVLIEEQPHQAGIGSRCAAAYARAA